MDEKTLDRHSVNCYYCGILFDEREGLQADPFNGGDGGSICKDCIERIEQQKKEGNHVRL